jgi:threonyl-tRNA synthetase
LKANHKELLATALIARAGGELFDLAAPLPEGDKLEILTFADDEGRETYRHSTSHVLAQAVKRLFPEAKVAIGPAIEDGFYYDFDFRPFTPDDLAALEVEMKNVIKEKLPIVRSVVPHAEAAQLFEAKGEKYKLELLQDIAALPDGAGEMVSLYTQGEFVDLCRGPQVTSTGRIGAFKLLSSSSAYWRGDEHNQMLQRIYGISFPSKEELEEYITRREEAAKRDHRKLGKELDLFVFSDLVGPGLPLYTPKGTLIKELLQHRVEEICRGYGFQKVMTPHLAKIELFKLSGHADKFGEELFHVTSKNQQFVLKPVQCPSQTQIYASRARSYRDLPIRYMESEKQYRAEKSGEVGGLTRVFAITVEDGHTFCRIDQVKDEIKNMVHIIRDFYTSLGMWENHWVSLSVRDYDHPEKYIGTSEDWDHCEAILEEVNQEMELGAKRREGEAALYGPKLDFMFQDAMGREVQIPTVQIDFATPKRFGLTYRDEHSNDVPPVMVHRAILGSYERFLALLIEHFAGAFPMWLMPVQVRLIPIADRHMDYARNILDQLLAKDVRAEMDDRRETMGNKIRQAQNEKIPYMLIIGDREMENGAVAVRHRSEGDLGAKPFVEFLEMLLPQLQAPAK